MKRSPELCPHERARELLGLEPAGLAEAIRNGELREVEFNGGSYLLGFDVDKALRASDPRELAKLVRGEPSEADPEAPASLAASVPRL